MGSLDDEDHHGITCIARFSIFLGGIWREEVKMKCWFEKEEQGEVSVAHLASGGAGAPARLRSSPARAGAPRSVPEGGNPGLKKKLLNEKNI